MTSATKIAGAGREAVWTREKIITSIQRWVALYGEPPRAADWNPSSAKWAGQTWRVPRYKQGDPETGEPWPSLNVAKRHFENSLNKAVIAAGFEPAKSGPKRRGAGPLVNRADAPPEVLAELDGARADVKALLEKLEARDALVERLRERLKVRAETPKVITKTNTVVKQTRVADEAAMKRVRDRAARDVAKAEAARDVVRAQLAEARQMLAASNKEARAAETKRSAAALRAKEAVLGASAASAELEAVQSSLRAAEAENEALRGELERARARGDQTTVIVKDSPEAEEVAAARAEAQDARRDAHRADVRAVKAEREYNELASVVKGEARKLSSGELNELRAKGPSGPAVLAEALKDVALARKQSPAELPVALGKLAGAAIRWRDAL